MYIYIYIVIEGSLEVKLPTIWTDEKQRWSRRIEKRRAEERRGEERRLEERRSEKRKSQKKEDADARKGRKVAKHCVFPMICGSGGSKSRLAKAAGAERSQLARWEMKNCTPLWREAHVEVKMYKTHQVRTTFGSCDVEKVHAVVARSTFPSQNVQNTSASDHFWKLRCRKSARRCGAKHISKSKCTKHTTLGSLLEVEMSKKCTPLWREAHFEVRMLKTLGFGPLLDVQMPFRVAGARDCAPYQKWAKREGYYNHHYTTLHSNTLHYNYNYTFTTFHYTTLHSTTLHYTQLHSITLNYTTLHYFSLHYTTLHYTTLNDTALHLQLQLQLQLQLHYITLHYANDITLHYTTLHYITLTTTT